MKIRLFGKNQYKFSKTFINNVISWNSISNSGRRSDKTVFFFYTSLSYHTRAYTFIAYTSHQHENHFICFMTVFLSLLLLSLSLDFSFPSLVVFTPPEIEKKATERRAECYNNVIYFISLPARSFVHSFVRVV